MSLHPSPLAGKLALVTGGGGAIGAAIVALFQAAGASVVSADRPGAPLPDGAASLPTDLGERTQIETLIAEVDRRHGRIDILVHCAGIARDSVLWKMSPEQWSEVLKVNLDAAFHLLRLCAPVMRRAGGGTVALVSSINGQRGKFGQANYVASKAGLIGLAKTAALELGGFGIRVNCVAPGWIETPLTAKVPEEFRERARAETPLHRLGQPEDVANAVLFLCSEMSRHVTGQVLRVDGGQLMA
ncbi:MAG: SDR family oxidoreductase [Vicinamibacteria bacterium]|nr:SDR family oxidoreductase [Vicinamibacteria bacterium]